MLGLALAGLTSCSDVADEITSLNFPRNLSPIDLEARAIGEDRATLEWTASEKATEYVIEVFADDSLTFAGSPAKTATVTATSVTLTGLVYDTDYSARVRSVTSGDASRDSKWSPVYFHTSTQQYMNSFKEEDIADRSVIVSWDIDAIGRDLTTLKAFDKDGKLAATKELSAEEVTAGKAVFGGLTPETQYTIRMYNGKKERGNRVVTTIADLAGAILLHAGDDIAAIIKEADANAVLALYGGTYEISSEEEGKMGAAKIEKNLTIKGIYPTKQPLIKGRFEIYEGASLTLSQLVIDGIDNATGDQTINFKTADVDYGALNVQDVTIKNFVKGICYGNVNATIESITFNNLRKSYAKKVTFSNSTISNSAQNRDLIRYDDSSGNYPGAAPVITVDKCTIYNVLNETKGKRLLYVRFVGNQITWTNTLVVQTQAVFTNQSKTDPDGITYDNNYYFNCTNADIFLATDEASDPKAYWNGDTKGKNGSDPKFKDAANGDFTVGNEDISKNKIGDPRW